MEGVVAFETSPLSPHWFFELDSRAFFWECAYPSTPRIPGPPPTHPHPAKRARLAFSCWPSEREAIRPYIRTDFPLQLKRRHYNDDVRPESYKASRLRFDWRQRNGIRELLGRCRDRARRLRCALGGNLPISLETPLHSETLRDIEFIRATPGDQICMMRDVLLRSAEELVRTRAQAQTKWNDFIPGSISAAAGKCQTVAAIHLLRHLNIGGRRGLASSPTASRLPVRCRRNIYFRAVRILTYVFPPVRFSVPPHLVSGTGRLNPAGGMLRGFGARRWSKWKRVGSPPLYLYQTMEIRRNGAPGGITFLSDSVFFNRASFAMGEI